MDSMLSPLYASRRRRNVITMGLAYAATAFGLSWLVLILGLVIAGIGVVWILTPSIPWLGHLPGDIRVERENFKFYTPLMTCL